MKDISLTLTMLGQRTVKGTERSGQKIGVGTGGVAKRCSRSRHLESPISSGFLRCNAVSATRKGNMETASVFV